MAASSLPPNPIQPYHNRKDAKKVSKLEAQIPYHEGRGNKEEVAKIKEQIDAIWEKTREAAYA
jgi:enamine deaminase RidA (YjgF/YER057c/UK114 family)